MGFLSEKRMGLNRALDELCRLVDRGGGQAWVVGGAVRDSVLGRPVTDLDVEVHGIPARELERLLSTRFTIDPVGRAFGVLKLRGLPLDVSLPRRESKAGLGHRGFVVQSDPYLSLPEAAARRDFTMNAMAFDPLRNHLVDPFDGRADLEAGVLRHCSHAFVEDPLRVLRGMQFAARFDLRGHDETLELCRTIEPEGLATERVWHEWRKLLLLGRKPSAGLAFLRDSGWLKHFPAVSRLYGCPQDPKHHPEGDVFTHTGLALDVFAQQRVGDEMEDLVVGLAVLCHDMGKPDVLTRRMDGRIATPGHEVKGVEVAEGFVRQLTGQQALVRAVLPLVATHGRPSQLYEDQSGDAAIRRLARDAGRVDRLARVVRADRGGRGARSDLRPACADWIERQAGSLAVLDQGPPPLIQGRHLMQMGVRPGPWVGEAIHACYEAQLDGVFKDVKGGLQFLRGWVERYDDEHPD